MDLWRKAKEEHKDPVEAWTAVIEDEAGRKAFHQARGKGGFRRTSWDEVLEIIAASTMYTVKNMDRSHYRFFADPSHVDVELCRRQSLPANAGRRQHEFL